MNNYFFQIFLFNLFNQKNLKKPIIKNNNIDKLRFSKKFCNNTRIQKFHKHELPYFLTKFLQLVNLNAFFHHDLT